MPADDSLKRLGGGRWETRDGRFAIEPQSGTWVVVDSSESDDLGLPLVRGPFGSLTAAREAIEAARRTGPAESPLAERVRQAGTPRRTKNGTPSEVKRSSRVGRSAAEKEPDPASKPPPPPAPPEPKWLRDLAPSRHRQATQMIRRLTDLGIDDAEAVARSEIADDRPALARLALERRLRALMTDGQRPAAVRATISAMIRGSDGELGARWQLVDERGRRIDELDLGD